jgi:hypothetical protein
MQISLEDLARAMKSPGSNTRVRVMGGSEADSDTGAYRTYEGLDASEEAEMLVEEERESTVCSYINLVEPATRPLSLAFFRAAIFKFFEMSPLA